MKIVVFLCFLICFFSACNTCEDCSYINEKGERIESVESCGNNSDREAFKSNLETQWGAFGEVRCVKS